MKTHVEFRSDGFPPYPDEEDETNPGGCGKRLADFVSTGLEKYGLPTKEPIAEDWGWVMPLKDDALPIWIGCAAYNGDRNRFFCFLESDFPIVSRYLYKASSDPSIIKITEALDSVLSDEPSIKDIRWQTKDEFNSPKQ